MSDADPPDRPPPPQVFGQLKASRGRPEARPISGARFTAPRDDVDEDDDKDPFSDDDDELLDADGGAGDGSNAGDDAASEAALDALEREAELALAEGGADDPLATFSAAEPPRVRLAEAGGEPLSIARFYAEIVDACTETIASLARDRALRPARERPATEARLLEQLDAILVTGPGCIDDLFRAFHRSLESKDPWRTWAPVFALGCIDGDESLRAIAAAIAGLPLDARARGRMAAEALSVAPHPELPRLATALSTSPHSLARAIGVELRSRRSTLGPDAITAYLEDPSAPVVEAALRALGRLDQPEPALVPELRRRMHSPDAAVAWQAARVLLLWGSEDPYDAVREGHPAAAGLGAQALEVFVLRGDERDLPRIEAWLGRIPVTAEALSAIARFGHAGVWAFLAHHLSDDALCEAAAAALETLFGDRVPAERRSLPRAWRDAIAAARFDPGVRYRRGEPWRPEVVVAEWAGGGLSRGEIALRADELIARAHAGRDAPLDGWTPEPEDALTALARAACAGQGAAGRWR